MGTNKSKEIEMTGYCYFCQEPILSEEAIGIKVYTMVTGEKEELAAHKTCYITEPRKI